LRKKKLVSNERTMLEVKKPTIIRFRHAKLLFQAEQGEEVENDAFLNTLLEDWEAERKKRLM